MKMTTFSKIGCIHRDIPEECNNYTDVKWNDRGGYIIGGSRWRTTDLFWDTGEKIAYKWPTGIVTFYRATNPHSGCFFLSQRQARSVLKHWEEQNWESAFQLSGPLEQAASGRLLRILKVMKPIPQDYKFLKVMHNDSLWKRHKFEEKR